jgi:hypothetical protein
MDIGSPFVADVQSAKLVEPGKTPFHNPSPSAKSAAVLGVPLGTEGLNMPVVQTLPDWFRVITAVAQHAIRSIAWTPAHPLQRRDSVNERERLLRVVTICTGELDCQRNALAVANQMTFAAKLGPISRIRTRLLPPKTARTELPSVRSF